MRTLLVCWIFLLGFVVQAQGQTYYYERVAVVENGQKRSPSVRHMITVYDKQKPTFEREDVIMY